MRASSLFRISCSACRSRTKQPFLAFFFSPFSTGNTVHTHSSRVNIFDRQLKRQQRDRAAWLMPSKDPLLDTVAENLLDRLQDCKKDFPTALCLGGSLQAITRSLGARGAVEKLIVMDASYEMVQVCKNAPDLSNNDNIESVFVVGDEEFLPIKESSVDLVISCLGLHWTNDLPGAMIQISRLEEMERIDARVLALESSVEFLKKVTSEQGSSIAEIKKNVSGMEAIRELLAKFMKKQGISLYSPDEEEIGNEKEIEGQSEGGGSEDEDDTLRSWTKKVELPSFEGVDPLRWIARTEKFFEVQRVKSSEKFRLAFISMEGDAVHWFQFWRQKSKHPMWEDFTTALIRRFGGLDRGSVFEKLASLRQTGTVDEYVREFELLVAQVTNTTEDQMLGYFLAGLRQDVRGQVRPHDPQDV